MEEKQTIIVLAEDGTEKEAEVLTVFNMKSTGKDYILYTLNEPDENDMVRIYASILVEKDGTYSFEVIESDEEWVQVKDVMKQMAKAGQEETSN
ncbi:MAG: DUF1292 domain-containing protein [Bacilli bacterium]|jgi:uncharacterized protein YrzB (UPF0473 family)|nr:DUF1292 domain-containing protein [Bacilli bacterium]MDD4831722.1 DUF1292 domain-containing protein [Bacilli bacterium]